MIRFRNATLSELKQILGWAAAEGWNPGRDDAEAFFAADPKGFFVAVDDSEGPVASISVVNHTSKFAFLGLYIVRSEFRERGIGFELWQHAIRHASSRTVGLDGVEAQQNNYQASGFAYAGGTTRFSGNVSGELNQSIRRADPQLLPQLLEMEAAASGVMKPAYLNPWLSGSPLRTTFVSYVGSGIDGFCTVRDCHSGVKIGPLVAENATVALRLIAHAASGVQGPISLDVPETATDLVGLCQNLGLQPGFKTARMYRGSFSVPGHKCFAVASLELG